MNNLIAYVAFDSEGQPVFDCDSESKVGAVVKLHQITGKQWPVLFAEGYRVYKINDRNGVMEDTGK